MRSDHGSTVIVPNRFESLAYNVLVRSRPIFDRSKTGRHLWRKFWGRLTDGRERPVATVIHDQSVVVNCGYTYPMFARMFEGLNRPLIEIVHQTALALHRPIHLVDVGAAVGDTVLLVSANCGSDVAHYYCVDGDKQFFAYLTQNLGSRSDCTLFNAILSSDEGMVPSLVRTHHGTASAQGTVEVRSSSLDDVLQAQVEAGCLDVIKIDIDGFDGRALAGARRCLAVASAVIFEWHPILCRQTGNSWTEPFEVLSAAGYTEFVWFNKLGEFSHFTDMPGRAVLDRMAEHCLADVDSDFHWDVVALKSASPVDGIGLSLMKFAKNRISRW